MSLAPGTKLAHYAIVEPVGKGRMGEVYRASDAKLGRDVAIKVLPDAFSEDDERLRRFQREAKVLASLNHPNIAAIYGLEQSGGTHYLVLELVGGETLAERLARGPIPYDEALAIAIQIAEALENAHEHGVVHRDLKPANIKLTPDGNVKVLDFGLAKAFAEESGEVDSSLSPTITRDATRAGVILGTAPYMSPEQSKGKNVDTRADVFAFGVVLFEMLSGKKAFPGDDVSEVLAAVIKLEPDWSLLPTMPARVQHTLHRCLDKDPRRRLHAVANARIDLEDGRDARPDARPSPPPRNRALVAALAGVAVLAFVAGLLWPRASSSTDGERFTVPLDPELDLLSSALTFSPNGRDLVFSALRGDQWQLYRRSRGELEAVPIPATEGGIAGFFSPRGDWLAFYTASGELQKIGWPSQGNPVRVADDAQTFAVRGSWSDDDSIVFTSGQRIMRVAANDGIATPITTSRDHDGGLLLWPQRLPNGRFVLFTASTGPEMNAIALASTGTGEWRALDSGRQARYVTTGHLLYLSQGDLWARAFDPDAGELAGEASRMLAGVIDFDVAPDGTLAYVAGVGRERRRLTWVSRDGVETPALEDIESFRRPRLSPDGRRVVVEITAPDWRRELWVYDLERGTRTRLTFENTNTDPLWTPDGRSITYASGTGNVATMFQRASDGTGEPVARRHRDRTVSSFLVPRRSRARLLPACRPDRPS